MGVFSNIQRALDKRLALLPNIPFVAWPNTKTAPGISQTYLRPTLLPAKSTLYTLNDENFNPGIYQIDIFTPLNLGVGAALDLADNIKSLYEQARTIVEGSDTIYIQEVSLIKGDRSDTYFMMSLDVSYICYSH